MMNIKTFAELGRVAEETYNQGHYDEALPLYDQMLVSMKGMSERDGANTADFQRTLAVVWMHSGHCLRDLGRPAAALERYIVSATICEGVGVIDYAYLILCNNIGMMYADREEFDPALRWYEKATISSEPYAPASERLVWFNNLATCLYELNRTRDAYMQGATAAKLAVDNNVKTEQSVIALKNSGIFCGDIGDFTHAIKYLLLAKRIGREIGVAVPQLEDIDLEIAEAILGARENPR